MVEYENEQEFLFASLQNLVSATTAMISEKATMQLSLGKQQTQQH